MQDRAERLRRDLNALSVDIERELGRRQGDRDDDNGDKSMPNGKKSP